MKMHMQFIISACIVALCLVASSSVLALQADAENTQPTEIATEEEQSSTSEIPPLTAPIAPIEAPYTQQLANIQTLLMYICGFAIVWSLVGAGKLIYRFFNMFF